MTAEPPAGMSGTYFERLRTPIWFYPSAVAVAILLGAEFAFAVKGWITWIPLLILLPACVLVVWRMSSGRVQVGDGLLLAGDQQLPLERVHRAIGLSPTELRRLVGRHSDPTAFVFIRSWIGPGVQLVLRPPAGDSSPHDQAAPGADSSSSGETEPGTDARQAPYWVVSTRHPDRLLDTLAAGSVPIA